MSTGDTAYPFDPAWNLETLVAHLNEQHRPGSLISGKTRNALICAWAVCVGRERAVSDLSKLKTRHGSRAAASRALVMSPATFASLEDHFASVAPKPALTGDVADMRAVVGSLTASARADFLVVAAELVNDPAMLRKLAASPELASIAASLSSAIRVTDLGLAVKELEEKLAGGVVSESAFQDWCDRHAWAFGNAYVIRDTKRRIDAQSTADMLLPNLVGYRDIVELKRPDAPVLCWDRSHKTHYFSAACSRAIAQVHKYMDSLHDAAQQGLRTSPHLLAYHPHAIIVIGRSARWDAKQTRALRGLNERLHGVTVMTFDHLLGQARQLLATIGA